MNQVDATNYYEILEVQQDAASHEIHKAYQKAKTTYSSDNPALYSMFTQEEAKELLRLIEEAYSVLGNQAMRKTYDESLSRGQPLSAATLRGMQAGFPQPQQPMYQPQSAPNYNQPAQNQNQSHQMMAQQHQALPDFGTPQAGGGADSVKLKKTEPSRTAPPPAGMGRTPHSQFKLDESFEAELAAATDFDGGLIQRTRLYKNVSIDKLSEITRISRPYLMALETNDYKSLPAAVFVRGFVVQIARALALDEAKVVNSYMKLFKAGGGK